jgi:hypothetical protein
MLINALNPLDLYKRSCHKKNKSDWKKMRKKFKSLTEKESKTRIKETENRENTKKPLTTELPKGGKQSSESETRHLPYLGIINKSTNKRLTPDFSKLPNVNLKH